MKKSIISMMLVGMMMLGTVNSYGTTKKTHFQTTKTEKVVKNVKKQDKNCDCKTCKDLVKKQQKVQKKNQCTCKNCKKVQKNQKQTSCKQKSCKQKSCNNKNHK